MIKIREIQNRKDVKDFIEFPLKLYKNVFGFVPPIYSDEKKLITRQPHKNIAESKFFLAERDGKIVGRIQAILHRQYNELKNERRVRFTRFDAIDDKEVAAALFGAVEDFAKEKGFIALNSMTQDIPEEIKKLNEKMPPYKAVKRVKLRSTEFEKNTSKKIIRFVIDKTID